LTLPGSHVAFHLLGHPIYAESADYALASALRIYTIILSSLVFVRTTDPRELAIALVTQMKVPYRIAYAFFIALRIIPRSKRRSRRFTAAQAVRGVVASAASPAGSARQALRHAASRRQPAQGVMMVMSMEARAFGAYPQRTFVEAPHNVGEWRRGLRGDAGPRVCLVCGARLWLCPYLLRAVGLSRWQARPGMMEATAASGPWPDVVAISILSSSSNAHRPSPRCFSR